MTENNGNAKTQQGEEGENPNSVSATNGEAISRPSSRRTPLTTLRQVDAVLALPRAVQEQEWDEDDDFEDPRPEEEGDGDGEVEVEYIFTDAGDDAFDLLAHTEDRDDGESNSLAVIAPAISNYEQDYMRLFSDAVLRDMEARLMELTAFYDLNDSEAEDVEDHDGDSQDGSEEVDPDELSYEDLLALGDAVGRESRGLSADTIASLPSISYKVDSSQNGINDSCVMCCTDYEDGETLTLLSCKHSYHSECINEWLRIKMVCPCCCAEVSPPRT